jgi:hypothetical protein
MHRLTITSFEAWKGRFILAVRSISETKRVRYLLGMSPPAEREHIELEYFENEDAFEEMLTAEDDLIDAYASGELTGDERRKFEQRFVTSLRGRDRVHFARAFADTVSATWSVEIKRRGTLPNIFKIFQQSGLLRTAMIATVMVFVGVLVWLVNDRRRLTNELRELRAESAEHSTQTQTLKRSRDAERTSGAEITAQLTAPRAKPDKQRQPGPQPMGHFLERDVIANIKREKAKRVINTQTAKFGNVIETISELPIQGCKFETLLSLQPTITRDEQVEGGRADQTNMTLDGVSVVGLNIMPQNMSSHSGTSVRGTTKDSNGNVVSGATVTLTDSARSLTRTQSTNKDGAYVFNAISPGIYSIEVNAPGFKTASASGLEALVNTPTVRDVQLEIGGASETVDVTSAAEAAINTSDATLGNAFEPKRITELPLDANDVVGLLSLQPSVSRTGFVNGERADQSNITLDGVDIDIPITLDGIYADIRIPSGLSWIRFQLTLKTTAIHEDYRVTIRTADARAVTSVDWSEPLTPNQTIIDTPAISTGDLLSGDCVLVLMGKEPDGSFVKVAEFSFKVIKY